MHLFSSNKGNARLGVAEDGKGGREDDTLHGDHFLENERGWQTKEKTSYLNFWLERTCGCFFLCHRNPIGHDRALLSNQSNRRDPCSAKQKEKNRINEQREKEPNEIWRSEACGGGTCPKTMLQ